MPIMTAVFDVPDDVWKRNPFSVETPFGRAVTIAKGDLADENDRLRTALENIIGAIEDNDEIAVVAYAKTALAETR